MKKFLFLCQALNAKLCHEIAGAIGVTDTCVELLDSDNEQLKEEALKLLRQNAGHLNKKFKFYRWAYGISAEHEKIKSEEIVRLINNFISIHNNLNINYYGNFSKDINCFLAKIYMCLISIAVNSLYKGGEVKIIHEYNRLRIIGVGEKVHIEKTKADIITGKIDFPTISVQNSHEYYTYYLMRHSGYKLQIDVAEDEAVELLLYEHDFREAD